MGKSYEIRMAFRKIFPVLFEQALPKVLCQRCHCLIRDACYPHSPNGQIMLRRSFKTSIPSYANECAPPSPKQSCRQNYHEESESLINKQINLELYASYAYLAMSYYFDREDVALPGFYKYFKSCASEEQEHAEMFMKYQNKRGGTITLERIMEPSRQTFSSALDATICALELEKRVNESLLRLHEEASKRNDPQLSDFIEENFLEDQVKAMKELSDMITNLERTGPGLGEFVFDRELDKEAT